MIQRFFEYKLTSEAYDSYYYIVTDLDIRTIRGLIAGEFIGLRGIANYTDVIKSFMNGPGNVLIIMNKDDVNKINSIEKFDYYNVDFLCKNNLKNLRRVLSFSGTRRLSNIIDNVINDNTMGKSKDNGKYNKLKKLNSTSKYKELHELISDKIYDLLSDIDHVENFEQLISIVTKRIKSYWGQNFKFSDEMIRNLFEYRIMGISSYYVNEKEYLVNSEVFKIPKDSNLIFWEDQGYKVTQENLDELNKRYKIKFVYNRESIFPIIRHLNKIKSFNDYKIKFKDVAEIL